MRTRKEYEKQYYLENRERILAYGKARREKRREIERRWREDNRERDAELKHNWAVKNPDKRLAHKEVEKALRRGELEKQSCEVCGNSDSHAHHSDYTRPLQVVWLCPQHHKDRHRPA